MNKTIKKIAVIVGLGMVVTGSSFAKTVVLIKAPTVTIEKKAETKAEPKKELKKHTAKKAMPKLEKKNCNCKKMVKKHHSKKHNEMKRPEHKKFMQKPAKAQEKMIKEMPRR